MTRTSVRAWAVGGMVICACLAIPARAAARSFSVSRCIFGQEITGPQRWVDWIEGDNLFIGETADVPLFRYRLSTGTKTALPAGPAGGSWSAVAAGDWVAWSEGLDIRLMNLKTGSVRWISDDVTGHDYPELYPSISNANGTYLVWQWHDDEADSLCKIRAKNLGTNGHNFTVVGPALTPSGPRIYGKRVAFLGSTAGGGRNLYFATIGSGDAPKRITDYGVGATAAGIMDGTVDMGDHLIAWRAGNPASGYYVVAYDFETSHVTTLPAPVPANSYMTAVRVSGDRIAYCTGGDESAVYVYDMRVAKTAPISASIAVTDADGSRAPAIDGSRMAWLEGRKIYFGKLLIPSISLKSTPKRIAHGAKLKISGSISDVGHRIAGARLLLEKYGSGKWSLVKTVTANANGEFTVYTAANHAKTKYRIAYDGHAGLLYPRATWHLSSRSAVKTAWPR